MPVPANANPQVRAVPENGSGTGSGTSTQAVPAGTGISVSAGQSGTRRVPPGYRPPGGTPVPGYEVPRYGYRGASEAPEPTPLPTWLASLRERQIALRVTPRGIDSTPAGQLSDADRVVAFRHRWALEQARTHPEWWNAVIGRTDQRTIGMHDIPKSPHAKKKGNAFGCAACGGVGFWLDMHLLAWCMKHKRWSADENVNGNAA